jgi:hypothetical protein
VLARNAASASASGPAERAESINRQPSAANALAVDIMACRAIAPLGIRIVSSARVPDAKTAPQLPHQEFCSVPRIDRIGCSVAKPTTLDFPLIASA